MKQGHQFLPSLMPLDAAGPGRNNLGWLLAALPHKSQPARPGRLGQTRPLDSYLLACSQLVSRQSLAFLVGENGKEIGR